MSPADKKTPNRHKRREFLDELRHRRTRQGSFENAMLHFDHPLPGGGQILEPSDRGTSAANIYRGLEPTPLWVILWKRSAAKLPRTGKKVLAALAEDWRTSVAAKIAGVSRPTVDHWKKLFKKNFRPMFSGLQTRFSVKPTLHFFTKLRLGIWGMCENSLKLEVRSLKLEVDRRL